MVPTLRHSPHTPRLLFTLASVVSQYVPNLAIHHPGLSVGGPLHAVSVLAKRSDIDHHDPEFVVFACLIPILVLLSGVFAGLTLGYMSLDETQLNVLSVSGTP